MKIGQLQANILTFSFGSIQIDLERNVVYEMFYTFSQCTLQLGTVLLKKVLVPISP